MKRLFIFASGVLCISAPTGFFLWYLFWFVYWQFIHREFYGQEGNGAAGTWSTSFGPVGTVLSLSAAIAFVFLGNWLIRVSRGDDDRPRSLLANNRE